jgi:hypothetical protein
MGHIKTNVGKREKMSKHHLKPIIIWKFLLMMMEQLNKVCGTKHDIFFGAKILKRRLLVAMQSLEVNVVKDIITKTRPLKVMTGVQQCQISSHISLNTRLFYLLWRPFCLCFDKVKYIESLMKLTQKKQDGGVKLVNVFKAKGTLTMHKICINENHCCKTLHLLVEVNNHLVERH